MFKHMASQRRTLLAGLSLAIALTAGLQRFTPERAVSTYTAKPNPAPAGEIERKSLGQTSPLPKLEGAAARDYLEQRGEYQSLIQAVTEVQYGLKRQEKSPFKGESGAGYLGMSHIQNLNAWFDESGITIRPTLSEKEGDKAWQLGFRLKAYGRLGQMQIAPPITSHNVKGSRIEYERGDCGLRIADCGLTSNPNPREQITSLLSNPQSAIRNPQLTEWYENRPAGIEQGFTVNERPSVASSDKGDGDLRLLVALEGGMRGRANFDGRSVELSDQKGKAVLIYGELSATDATGRKLQARMETNGAGDEIALVVDDREAAYPVVIDPITASREQKLDAGSRTQAGAEFGTSVAIDFDTAVVGAWLEDIAQSDGTTRADAGVVYILKRTNASWSISFHMDAGGPINGQCGYSVALSGSDLVFGCPGVRSNTGIAYLGHMDSSGRSQVELSSYLPGGSALHPGDRFGEAVAISGTNIGVGAPFTDTSNGTDSGMAYLFEGASPGSVPTVYNYAGNNPNSHFGTSVAISSRDFVAGAPGSDPTYALVVRLDSPHFAEFFDFVSPAPGFSFGNDGFGQSVAIDGDTLVIGAPYDLNSSGERTGAAYVFTPDPFGWKQRQKLVASDGRDGDKFSYYSVAVEGNTIVVGAPLHDQGSVVGAGAAYVFMRNINTWTQQAIITAGADAGTNYQFGIGVDISGDSVIVGQEHAAVSGKSDAGAAYVYRLSCVAPSGVVVLDDMRGSINVSDCPGSKFNLNAVGTPNTRGTSPYNYQWRHNGVNIQGATNGSYLINNATASDAGTYDVIVTNSCGGDISQPITLTIKSFTLNPTLPQNFSASGSNGIVNVTTDSTCPWTAQSNASWITITSGSPGKGNGTVGFTVAANTGASQRTGTITIGQQTFTVTQDGLNCSYSISSASNNFSSAATTGSVALTTNAGCAWTAASTVPWLTVTSAANGTGSATVNYSVSANTGPQRTGTLVIAGQTFTVTQASGCTFSISPASSQFNSSGGSNSVTVTTGGGCTWAAQSNSSFITITSGASGTGNGTVSYTVAANQSTSSRTGTMTIAGQTFTVTQDAAPPALSVQFSQASYTVGEADAHATITVTRSGDTSGAATVNYATSDTAGLQACSQFNGVASQRCDYAASVGILRFSAGETAKTIFIPIVDDSYAEGNETFTITLSSPAGVSLGTPSSASITIIDNDVTTGGNPIVDPSFFIRQQYIDFLGREPDPAGLAGWLDVLANCGTKYATPCDRIEVSAGFFRSTEFQDRGYFIFRFYPVALGRNPNYSEFIPDLAKVSGFLTDAQLEANKVAFVSEFMSRTEFQTKYSSLTDSAFVDALLQTAGLPNHPGRDGWKAGLANNSLTRARVLRELAESREVYDKFYNQAFVVMQYFGYLRRDPDILYLQWIDTMNKSGGDYRTMINGFMNSSEYFLRFGP